MRTYGTMAGNGRRTSAGSLTRTGMARALLLVAGTLSFLLAGCATAQSNAVSLSKTQVFTWPLTGGATKIAYEEVLDPAAITYQSDMGTASMLFVGLVRFDGNLQIQPDAASSYDISSDGITYTFHLRQNMKFSDGTPLQAQDFVYSIKRALDPNLCTVRDANTYQASGFCDTPGQEYLAHVANISALDPQTVEIQLDKPIPYFLQTLTYPTSFAVEQSFIEKKNSDGSLAYPGGTWVDHLDKGGCSGPFQVDSYGDGTTMRMVPNTNWESAWGKQMTLTAVVRPLLYNGDTEYENYRKGQYDYADVPAIQYDTARTQGDFKEIPTLTTRYFALNFATPPFDQLNVRQAFALALNKQLLVDKIENGGAIPTNHIVPQGMPGYNPDLQQPDGTQTISGNQGKAQQLLKTAQDSCAGLTFFDYAHRYCQYISGSNLKEIDIWTRDGSATGLALTQGAAAQWSNALKLNVVAKTIPKTQFSPSVWPTAPSSTDPTKRVRVPSSLQSWNLGWAADYVDPQDWLSILFHTGQTYNASWVNDNNLDKLLDTADVDLNPTQRMKEYNQAEQMLINEAPWVPYQQDKFYWRQRSWVRGFGFNSLRLVPDVNWADVQILDH